MDPLANVDTRVDRRKKKKEIGTQSKFDLDIELDNFVRAYNIGNHDAVWRLSRIERRFMDIKYNKKNVKKAIERYGNEMLKKMSKEGFRFIKTEGKEGLPFRYFALASYIADDKFEGRTHKDFMNHPKNHLSSGVHLLMRVLLENLKDKARQFIEDLEQVLNKTYDEKTALCIIGVSNTGKSLLASMITRYVNLGLITQTGERTPFTFQDTIDKRVCLRTWGKVPRKLEKDYLAYMSKSDPIQVKIKRRPPILLTDCKPPLIITAYDDPFINCVNRVAFENRVIKYHFQVPLDPACFSELKKTTGYPYDIPITPMHYIVLISMLQNMKKFTPQTIDDYINVNNFIDIFKSYMKQGTLSFNASVHDLDAQFKINMPSEKNAG